MIVILRLVKVPRAKFGVESVDVDAFVHDIAESRLRWRGATIVWLTGDAHEFVRRPANAFVTTCHRMAQLLCGVPELDHYRSGGIVRNWAQIRTRAPHAMALNHSH